MAVLSVDMSMNKLLSCVVISPLVTVDVNELFFASCGCC